MKLKLESDGTVQNTKIMTTNGDEIEDVLSVQWELDPEGVPIVTVVLIGPEVNVVHKPRSLQKKDDADLGFFQPDRSRR